VKRFRGGLVFKAHRLSYHSTLGSRVITKKKKVDLKVALEDDLRVPEAFGLLDRHAVRHGIALPEKFNF